MRQSSGAFTSNGDRNRAKLYKLSYMAFMLYLGKASAYRVKTGDLGTYEKCRGELYMQYYKDKALYEKGYKRGRFFPQEIDRKNPAQNTVNFAYFVLKQKYKEIFERNIP